MSDSAVSDPAAGGAERRTVLYAEHAKLGAKFVPYAGWRMPVQYRGVAEEHQAVRSAVGLFDVSHMGRLELSGKQAWQVVDGAITNDLRRIGPGQALYTCCCAADGGILDDLIIYLLDSERVMVVCNAANRAKIVSHLAALAAGRCQLVDRSDETCLIAVQGPKALALLVALGVTVQLPEGLPSFHWRAARLAGIDCSIARTGYTGEDGVEIFGAAEDAVGIWCALLRAGEAYGVQAVGLAARDTLRLEARLSLYGNEIDESTNPLEAGLRWTVKLDGRRFIGSDALGKLDAQGLRRRLVGFQMTGRGIARHGYPIVNASGVPIGVCTSGAPSPTLGVSIGLGYVPLDLAAVGSELTIDCRGRPIPARVVPTPFYRRPEPGKSA